MSKEITTNLIFGRAEALRGTRNPHAHNSAFRFLRAVRLASAPKYQICNAFLGDCLEYCDE
jgi:hypothetical protein